MTEPSESHGFSGAVLFARPTTAVPFWRTLAARVHIVAASQGAAGSGAGCLRAAVDGHYDWRAYLAEGLHQAVNLHKREASA